MPRPGETRGFVDDPKIRATEIWAQLFLCDEDCARIRDFFVLEFGIKPRYVVRNMHITVYYARRPIPGVVDWCEPAHVVLSASETRFMVMAPGGENPRPELDPGKRKVGLRVHKQSVTLPAILEFRNRLLQYETRQVLGNRFPSTRRANAFGARHFQPHMAVLRAGSRIGRDLTLIGAPFRETMGNLTFDRFAISIVRRTGEK